MKEVNGLWLRIGGWGLGTGGWGLELGWGLGAGEPRSHYFELGERSYMKEQRDIPKNGPLFKSESGEFSNLRWDMPPIAEMDYYWDKGNRKDVGIEDWKLLKDFTLNLAGGGQQTRTHFVMDHINLPEVINEMAAQTMILNMDRCTKNYYVYLNPDTNEWSRFPWDLDAALGQSNGLGGTPGNVYCVLACEQGYGDCAAR
eukprot:gene18045-24462_t